MFPLTNRRLSQAYPRLITVVAIFLLLFGLTACSSKPESATTEMSHTTIPAENDNSWDEEDIDFDFSDERDPFEDFNRDMWYFNRDILDRHIILPAANTYEHVPRVARHGIYSFTQNLNEPVYFVNNILQFKFKEAGINVTRFTMNTLFGFLGFFDVASSVDIHKEKETFGETLGYYGVPDGPYMMLPGVGPTVVIDRGGELIDIWLIPSLIHGWPVTLAKYALSGLQQRIELKELEPILENSLDSYSFVREAYFSNWRDRVFDGNPPAEADEWGDEWDSDWSNEWDDDWDDWPEQE